MLPNWACPMGEAARGSPSLALVIPTFRRTAILRENLDAMAAELAALGVAVYISDDSPDGETEAAVHALAEKIPGIHYRRNDPALGHDANLVASLIWPETDYVWLLGDALRIKPGCLGEIVGFLADQDLLLVNSHSDDRRMIPAVQGDAAHALLRDALWHQTQTGSTIYHRRVCDWVREQDGNLTVVRNFPQLSMILGFASACPVRIGWFGEPCLQSAAKKSYWRARAISVFVDDWATLVGSFPAVIPAHDRARIIGTHSARMDLFNTETLLEARSSGFNWAALRRPDFRAAMHLPYGKLVLLLLTPRPMIPLVLKARIARQRLTGVASSVRRRLFRR